VLLTPERIKQVLADLHRRNPRKILAAIEIYQAIAQAQHEEDIKEEVNDDRNKSSHNTGKGSC